MTDNINEKEIRNGAIAKAGDGESRTVEGYAIVFGVESDDLGFREIIHKGAVTEDTIRESDVLARFCHSEEKVLARCKNGVGSLRLTVDEKGLKYEFDAPKTALGDELLELIRRGDISNSSFAFTIAKDGDKWTRDKDGTLIRDVYRIERLYDIAPVFHPAYSATSCSTRELDRIKAVDEKLDALMERFKSL